MNKVKSVKGAPATMPVSFLKGWVAAAVITLVGAALMSKLILSEVLKETAIGYCAMGIIIVSSLLGGYTAIQAAKRKPMIIALCSGVIYWLTLMGMNALLCKGEYEGVLETAFMVLGGAMCAIFVHIRPKKQNLSSRRKKWNR